MNGHSNYPLDPATEKYTQGLHREIGRLQGVIAVKDKTIAELKKSSVTPKELQAEKDRADKAEKKCASLQKQLDNSKCREEDQCRIKVQYRQEAEERRHREKELLARIQELEKANQDLQKVIDAQNRVIADKESLAQAIQHSRQLNSSNSSVPSSQNPPSAPKRGAKICNSRVSSGRKPGKQPGAPGAHRPSPTAEDLENMETIDLLKPIDGSFDPNERDAEGNPVWELLGKKSERMVIGYKLVKKWTKYISYRYRNKITGEVKNTPYPPTVVNEVNYSPETKALLLYLQEACNVTPRKSVSYFQESLFGESAPSVGLAASLPKQFSLLLDKYKADKVTRLLDLDGLHVDHTPVKMNNKQLQVLVLRHPEEGTCYIVCKSKGLKDLDLTPLKQYAHTLVHDHAVVFYHYGTGHQECLAHDLRYLKSAQELDNRLTWPGKMQDLMQEMIHAVHASDTETVTVEEKEAFQKRYEEIIALAEREYEKYPPSRYNKDGYNLAVRLKTFEKEHLTFLLNPEVEPTNNEAEKAARKVKTLQRRKGTWRKDANVQYDCDCQMFIEDCRLRNLDPIKMMAYIIRTNGTVPEEFNSNVPQQNVTASSA